MDIDLFRDGEQFSTFDSHNFLDPYPDDSTSLDDVHNFSTNELYDWDMTHERELNGDLALIPSTSSYCETMNTNQISKSPPVKEDFQRIMSEWQQFISMDTGCDDFPIEDPIILPEENDDETAEQKYSPLHELLNLPSTNTFDITMYLSEDEPKLPVQNVPVRKQRAGVKKIDLKAQKYIIDEDEADVDIETVSECESAPVLEAGDLNSLLLQFEATQIPELPPEILLKSEVEQISIKLEPMDASTEYKSIDKSNIRCKPEIVKVEKDLDKIKKEVETEVKDEPKTECHVKRKEAKVETQEFRVKEERKLIKMEVVEVEIEEAKLLKIKHEDAMPQQAVKHVMPPIPVHPKKTTPANRPPQKSTTHETRQAPPQPAAVPPSKSPQNVHQSTESTTSNIPDPTKSKLILDALPRELIARIKESGKRKTISVIPPIPSKRRCGPRVQEAAPQPSRSKPIKQPVTSSDTVKLDHDYCSPSGSYPKHPKKDSGFESGEEDERAMMGKQPVVKNADGKLMVSLLKVNTIRSSSDPSQKKKLNLEEYKKRREGFLKSQSSSQNCSPMSSTCNSPMPEDENTRLIKHQEKLMRMAQEVLNTPPKSERKAAAPPAVILPPQPVKIPADMEKKTLVSIGVNTDFKICKNIDPLAPVEQLEQIKPLLKKASAKINCNSLITSLIENIPKVMSKSDPKGSGQQQATKAEHGEDKTIVYLPKNRAATKTANAEVQTNISLIQQCKQSRYRRRRDSSSSSSSSYGSRKSATSSRYSRLRNESCSSGSSSSSRSSRSSRSGSYSSYSSGSSSHSRSSRSRSSRSRSPRSRSPSSRSISPRHSRRERERLREVEERRVIYVGRISSSTSRDDLRKRFQRFGPITNISLHFRDHGDNYGFVTFANKLDAYEAIEHGNDDPYHPKYDLSFGGRRIFCKTSYSDLDNMRDESNTSYYSPRVAENSFDTLLREAQEKLRKRKA